MSHAQFFAEASQWVVQAAFWCAIAFIAWYTICAPWWRSPVGRAIVALDAAIALTLLPSVAGLILGHRAVASGAYQWLTLCALACVPVITCWRMVIVWRIQRQADRDGR